MSGCSDPPGAPGGGADADVGIDAPTGPDADGPGDIYDELVATDGMISVEERDTDLPGYRFFHLVFEQPSDHDQPEGQTFGQRLTLLHVDYDAPMVLTTTGYAYYRQDWLSEPGWLLGGNQVMVEHRFFASSRPDPANWDHLRIRQAAADHHRIVEALKPLYGKAWVSTGGSKGGMTSIYHRRFHPEDVDATIAYVAPISFGAPDDRYASFFDTVGPEQCRQSLRSYQRDLLENRRTYLESRAATDALQEGWTFSIVGGVEEATEAMVIEFEWGFWQYLDTSYCSQIPAVDASDSETYQFLGELGGIGEFSDSNLLRYLPYYFQTEVELGYPEYSAPAHIADLLLYPEASMDSMYPAGFDRTYHPAAMLDIADWVATEGSELMFIYGEWDPWTAGEFELGDATDSYKYLVPQGNHGSSILDLPEPDLGAALSALESWTGLEIGWKSSAAARRARTEKQPPRDRPPLVLLRSR